MAENPGNLFGECREEEDPNEDVTVIGAFAVTAFAIGILTTIAQSKISILKGVPYTLLVFIMGILFGLLNEAVSLGQLSSSIDNWRILNPEILLYIFLPPLLFASAFSVDYHIFRKLIWQAILLATVGVLISTFLTAFVAVEMFSGYAWTYREGLLFGAMFAATDPVAVVALLHELGAPETLSVMIEGESLLNDGVGFVLFLVFFYQLSGREVYTIADITLEIFRASFGGLAIGLILGGLGLLALQQAWDDSTIAVAITVTVVFGTFFISELFEVSGVIGVVTLGLVFAAFSNGYVKVEVDEELHHFWHKIEYMANAMVFAFSGVVVIDTLIEADNPYVVQGYDILNLVINFGGLNIIRFIAVFSLFPLLKNLGYGISWQRAVIVSYGGLRGAVGLIAALFLLNECSCAPGQTPDKVSPCIQFNTKNQMMFQMAGIVLLTMAINGTTAGFIVNKLKLNKSGHMARHAYDDATYRLHKHTKEMVETLKRHPHYRQADWVKVWSHLPILSQKVLMDRTKDMNVGQDPNHVAQNLERSQQARFMSIRVNPKAAYGGMNAQMVPNGGMSSQHASLADSVTIGDARERFLELIKANYRKQFRQGACSSWPHMQTLVEATKRCQDKPDRPINEWAESIEPYVNMPGCLARTCGDQGSLATRHMANSYDIVITFLRAHKNVISQFQKYSPDHGGRIPSSIIHTILGENQQQIALATQYTEALELNYPEIARGVKTDVAIQRLIKEIMEEAEEMCARADIDEKDLHHIQHEVDHALEHLNHHRASLHSTPTPDEVLRNISIFDKVDPNVVMSLVNSGAIQMRSHNQGEVLIQPGQQLNNISLIVRGKVELTFPATNTQFTRFVGDTTGTVEFITNHPAISRVVCTTTVEVWDIPFTFLNNAISQHKQLEKNLLREAGIMSLEFHFPKMRNAPFEYLARILPHIRVVGQPSGNAPVTFKNGIAVILKGRVAYQDGKPMELMVPFAPNATVWFSRDAKVLFVKKEAASLLENMEWEEDASSSHSSSFGSLGHSTTQISRASGMGYSWQ